MSGDLWCLMRAAELERRRLERAPDQELEQLGQCARDPVDPDDMQDDDQPYFWNRRR